MREYVSPPPEHDHVEAWIATIAEVNPTSPFELAKLQANIANQHPSGKNKEAIETRIAELGVAQKAVQSLVVEYLPLAKPYGRNTKGDPSPFEYDDRLQAARASLVESAWRYRPGKVDSNGVPMLFADYAEMQMKKAVAACKGHESRFFDLTAGDVEVMFLDSKRNHPPGRDKELAQYAAVQEGQAVEDLEPEDKVTPNDPTFDAAAGAELLRIYGKVSAKWASQRRRVAIEAWGLLGDAPFETYADQGNQNGLGRDVVRREIRIAKESLRAPYNIRKFEGYVPDELIKEGMEAKSSLSADAKPQVEPATSRKALNRTDRSRVVWKNEQALEPGVLQLKELLNNPELFSTDRPDFNDLGIVTQAILESCPDLGASHIEMLWNRDVSRLVSHMHKNLGPKFELSRVGQIFSMLLRATMTERSEVTLHIPPHLDRKMNYIGAWLEKGSLLVVGDVGMYAGIYIGPDATINISGSAGEQMGTGAQGYISTTRDRPR